MESKDTYLSDYTIIKELGKGMHGTVYLVEDKNKKKYGMKVEQVFKKDLPKNLKSPIWRELDFAENLLSKYPDYFMQIYKSENKKCNYVHKLDDIKWQTMSKDQTKYYKKLFKSPYCSIKITSLVDDMLHNILYKLTNKKIILDLFIQVVNLAYLINKEGYYHRDFHPKNIGIIYTKDKTIKILNSDIKTHGYKLNGIDYGMVLHNKYDLEPWEKQALKYDNDLYQNFYKIVFKIMLKNLTDKYPHTNINQLVPISEQDAKHLDKYLKHIKIDNGQSVKDNYKYFQELLYKIVYFDKFQEQLRIEKKVKLFEFIPVSSVTYIVKNYYHLKKILIHLIKLQLVTK